MALLIATFEVGRLEMKTMDLDLDRTFVTLYDDPDYKINVTDLVALRASRPSSNENIAGKTWRKPVANGFCCGVVINAVSDQKPAPVRVQPGDDSLCLDSLFATIGIGQTEHRRDPAKLASNDSGLSAFTQNAASFILASILGTSEYFDVRNGVRRGDGVRLSGVQG